MKLLLTISIMMAAAALQAQQQDSIMLADGKIWPCTIAETSSGFDESPVSAEDALHALSYGFDVIIAKWSDASIHTYKAGDIIGFYSSKAIGTSHLEPVKGRWYYSMTVPKTSMAELLSKKEIGKKKFACVLEKGKYITLYYTKLRTDSDGSAGAWAYGTQAGDDRLYELMSNVSIRPLIPKCPDMIYNKRYNKKGQSFYQFLMDVAGDYNKDRCQ